MEYLNHLKSWVSIFAEWHTNADVEGINWGCGSKKAGEMTLGWGEKYKIERKKQKQKVTFPIAKWYIYYDDEYHYTYVLHENI